MFVTPAAVLGVWFRGLLAIAIIAGGIVLLRAWYDRLPRRPEPVRSVDAGVETEARPRGDAPRSIADWRPGFDRTTALFAGGVFLLFFSVGGRLIGPWIFLRPGPEGRRELRGGQVHRIPRSDGTELHVEVHGPATAPTVVLTHGWSLNRHEWIYLKEAWGDRFRLVVWDLPGLGDSTQPHDRNFELERMAAHLAAVIEFAGTPVTLVGHSIGGMIIQTYCRLFPEQVGTRVLGAALIHTTFVNPLRTMSLSGLMTALEKPVIVPLLHLQIWFWPLVWASNWLSYLNGSTHWSVARNGFGGAESRTKLNFVTRFQPKASPAVVARGALAMLKLNETATLPRISMPVLVMAASLDPVTLPEASDAIRAALPRGRLHTLQPTRHFGLIEFDREFAQVLGEFFDSVNAKSEKARIAG